MDPLELADELVELVDPVVPAVLPVVPGVTFARTNLVPMLDVAELLEVPDVPVVELCDPRSMHPVTVTRFAGDDELDVD